MAKKSLLQRQATNLIMLAVGIGLVVALLVTRGDVTTSEGIERESYLLGAFRNDEVSRIVLETDQEKLILERGAPDEDGVTFWKLKSPVEEDAEESEVESYLTTLEYADFVRKLEDDQVDRTQQGLDKPRLTLRISMKQINYELLFGTEAVQPKGAVYVEVKGKNAPRSGVYLISASQFGQLSKESDFFRQRELMPYVSSGLTEMSLTGEGGPRRLKAAQWGGWRFDGQQGDYRVSRRGIDYVLSQFGDLTADRFITTAAAEKAQAGAKLVSIRMQPRKKELPVGLVEVGGKCPDGKPGVVALRKKPDPLAACAPETIYKGLTTPAEDLVDKRLVRLRLDEVETLAIKAGERRLELARNTKGFRLRAPEELDVELELGNDRLRAITRAEGNIVADADPKELGLKARGAAVVVVRSGGKDEESVKEEILLVGKLDGGKAHVLRQQDGAILEIGPDVHKALQPDATLVRKRQILELDRYRVQRIKVTAGDVKQTLLRDETGAHKLEGFDTVGHDSRLVTEFMSALSTLTVERWVADEDDGSFGLSKPSTVIEIESGEKDGGQVLRRITLGAPAQGGVYGRIDGDAGVFVLPRHTEERLTTWLLDRSVFMLDPSEVVSITLKREGRTLVLEKDGERFRQKSAEGLQLSANALQRIVESLKVMRAEAALHTGPARASEGLGKPVLTIHAERLPARGERSKPVDIEIGAGDSWRNFSVFYARREDIDATYVIARSKIQPILDAL